MLKIETSTSVMGSSNIEVTNDGETITKQIAYMTASVPDKGDYSINKSIQDRELFDKHKEEVLSDFKKFEEYVYSIS